MMYFLESRLTNEVNIMCDVRRNFLEIKKKSSNVEPERWVQLVK